MANPEHVNVVRGGSIAIREWRKANPKTRLDLRSASLSGANLNGASLSGADLIHADLSDAELNGANLRDAILLDAELRDASLSGSNLSGSNLSGSNLSSSTLARAKLPGAFLFRASLFQADICGANLNDANLCCAILTDASLRSASLSGANLNGANLSDADLSGADLSGAQLIGANLTNTYLLDTNFKEAVCAETVFANTDLSQAVALDSIKHWAPSEISIGALERSKGNIPEDFLRGCGLTPWQILNVRLYDPTLAPANIAEIQRRIFDERTKGYFFSGIFISYSRDDAKFVDKIHARLKDEGANVWLDSRHAVAGPLERQIERAIRVNDVVLLVLSRSSVESDWVEAELEWALEKEKERQRPVLCPVALDDSWKAKVTGSVLWRKVKDKYILDFSRWQTEVFGSQFQKLLDGLKVWYGPNTPA